MEEKKATSNPNCEECNSNSWKYKCPACFVRTCSLPCVKSHKQRTGCTGKRSLTEIVPLSKFDDNLLLSDYNMLEDVKRVAESAKRMRLNLRGYSQFRLPFPLKKLRRAAFRRRTKMLFLSSGMSRREKNQTSYNTREDLISWTIEWRFNSTDTVLIDHGVRENTTLLSMIENHLKPGPWNHPLRQFCEEPLDSLKLFIRKYPKGTKSPFHKLDMKASLGEQLADKYILEYPVIYVYLPSQSIDFEVIKDSIPQRKEHFDELDCDIPSPKGVTFREEDVEDDGSLDPHVSDLLASASSTKDICDDTQSDLEFIHSLMNEKELWDYSPLNEALLMDEELEDGEIAPKSSEPVLTTGSFVNGHFNEDGQDICDVTFSDLDIIHSSMEEKEACSYLDVDVEAFFVDEELEEGEIA